MYKVYKRQQKAKTELNVWARTQLVGSILYILNSARFQEHIAQLNRSVGDLKPKRAAASPPNLTAGAAASSAHSTARAGTPPNLTAGAASSNPFPALSSASSVAGKTDEELLAEALARSMDPAEQKSSFVRDLVQATKDSSRVIKSTSSSLRRRGSSSDASVGYSGSAAAAGSYVPNIPGAVFAGKEAPELRNVFRQNNATNEIFLCCGGEKLYQAFFNCFQIEFMYLKFHVPSKHTFFFGGRASADFNDLRI